MKWNFKKPKMIIKLINVVTINSMLFIIYLVKKPDWTIGQSKTLSPP